MVKEILFHPEYSPQRIFNNLAIIITESNFVYQKHIGPVCLPRPNENFEGQVNISMDKTFRLSLYSSILARGLVLVQWLGGG